MTSRYPDVLVLSSEPVDYAQAVLLQEEAREKGLFALIAPRVFSEHGRQCALEYRVREHPFTQVWVLSATLSREERHLTIDANRHGAIIVARHPDFRFTQ